MSIYEQSAADPAVAPPRRLTLIAAVDSVSTGLAVVGALAIGLILVIMITEIVARNVLNAPTTWSVEFVTYLVVGSAFLPLALLQKNAGHIRVELLLEMLGPRRRVLLEQFGLLVSLFLVSLMTWQYAAYVIRDFNAGSRDWGLMQTPLWIPETPVFVGLLGFTLAICADIVRGSHKASPILLASLAALFAFLAVFLCLLGLKPVYIVGRELDYGTVAIFGFVALAGLSFCSGPVAAAFVSVIALLSLIAFQVAGLGTGAIGIYVGLGILAMLITGMPISIAIGLVAFMGLYFFLPLPQLSLLADRPWRSINSYTYSAIPMFVVMGSILVRAGATESFFTAIAGWLGRLPGGLAHAGLVACGLFSAVSGSSIATAATIGQVATPEMLKRGYSRKLALGSIAGGGTLGILIPPSVPMIIYGATVGAPVLSLFLAGMIPGLMVLLSMMAVVLIWGLVSPASAPTARTVPLAERLHSVRHIIPVLTLIAIVLGSLYSGYVTPTEAGALGVVLAMGLAAFQRTLTLRLIRDAFIEATKLTASLMFIVVATSILTWVMDFAQVPKQLVSTIESWHLSVFWLLFMLGTVYLILGMFIDPISMMLMTVSVTYPVVVLAGYDAIWFGVALMLVIELGLITPPVGMILFVQRGLFPDIPLRDSIMGALPFVMIILFDLVLICIFPEIVTWLPSLVAHR